MTHRCEKCHHVIEAELCELEKVVGGPLPEVVYEHVAAVVPFDSFAPSQQSLVGA